MVVNIINKTELEVDGFRLGQDIYVKLHERGGRMLNFGKMSWWSRIGMAFKIAGKVRDAARDKIITRNELVDIVESVIEGYGVEVKWGNGK